MVGRAAGRRPLHALEIGCGEGIFTTMLAPLCASVLAVDVSEVALSRARERCAEFDHVRFCCWDVCSDPPLGTFGIVVCMDVVDTIHWPPAQRRAIAKVDRSVAPRGSLIVTAVLQSPVVENANWGRRLGRGGQNIVARFSAQDRRLVRRETHLTDHHILTRFAASR
jgi:2-polyprenyl-3-methyl-5-hydroxy-6-metoxy-1,4-benzoquinol methylase